MKSEILVAHIVTKLLRICFTIFAVLIGGYIFVVSMTLLVNHIQQWSWLLKIPILLVFGGLVTLVSLIAALPLFWLDKVKKRKKGLLGNYYLAIEQDNASKTQN